MFYIEIFIITTILSTFFALGGVWSATAIVPIMDWLGINFNFAKAIWLFVNTTTTATATIMNIKRKVLDIKSALPLAISLALFAPFGAMYSRYIPEHSVKLLFAVFLLFSWSMILFWKKEQKFHYDKQWVMVLIGMFVWFISGLLWIWWWALLMPIMILLWFNAKKLAVIMSFVIPFSTFAAFLTYMSFVKFDWIILWIAALWAIIGWYIGNYLMHFKLNQNQIKKIIWILLYIIALKMIYGLL